MVSLLQQPQETRVGHGLLRDLVSVWPLAFPNGGVVDLRDLKGGNTLTDNGGVTTAAGPSSKLARATQFTAAGSQYLSSADNASLSFGVGVPCTIIVWFRPDTATFMGLVGKWSSVPNAEFDLHFNGINCRCDLSSDGTSTDAILVTDDVATVGAWNAVCFEVDPMAQRVGLQLNAGIKKTISYTGSIFNGASPLFIGLSAQGGGYMNGALTGARLWKRTLSDRERIWHYNGGQGRRFRRNRGFY